MDQIENYTPIKSKIILLLKALKKQEIRNLNSYLKPYIPIADWARLLKYLLKFHPEFNLQSKNLSQRIVFQRVFGGANFDSIKLTKKLYEAHQEVKKFLIFEKINEKNPLYEILLAREFHNRNLKKHFSALENQRRKKPMGIKSEFTFLQNFLWDHFKYFESTSPKMVVENIELVDANNNLNLFFIASTLKHACELLFRGNLKPEEHPIFFLEQVEKYCKSNELKLPILIHFYWLTFQLIKERDEKKYFILEKYFYTNNSSIKYSDRLIIITYLINFSSQKIRSNDKRFLLKAFSLYKYGMQNKIFIINQQFIKGHFLNILYLSCYLDEIEWIELFLHDSEEDIKGWIDPATLEIGKARLCFAKKRL